MCNNRNIWLWSQVNPTPWEDRPVSVLFNESKLGWNIGKLISLFPHNAVWNILAQCILPTKTSNRLYWPLSNNWEYSAKSSYDWLMSINKLDSNKRVFKMWKIQRALCIPTHRKVLLWKAFYNALPTGRTRRMRMIGQHYDCLLCENSK